MGYRTRMAPEVEEWLADIQDRDPAPANRIHEAIAVLRAGGNSVGPPLVVPLDDLPRHPGPTSLPGGRAVSRPGGLNARMRSAWRRRALSGARRRPWTRTGSQSALSVLDTAYQRQLHMLMRVQNGVAAVDTSRKRLELQVGELEHQVSELDNQIRKAMEAGQGDITEEGQARRQAAEGRLADVRRQYAEKQASEERLTQASQRLMTKVEAFRASREAAKYAYAAAQEEAEAAWAEVTDAVSGEAERPRSAAHDAVNADTNHTSLRASWLAELRPGAPESVDARILFAVEPAGTAVLLVGGMERDRLQAWYDKAIPLCHIRYQREKEHTTGSRGSAPAQP